MKKFLLVLLILLLVFGGYILYDTKFGGKIPKLDVEEEVSNIDELFIYGTYLNLNGSLVNDNNLDLVLYNGDFTEVSINKTNTGFNLSDKVNEGINLESIPEGKYYVFLRSKNKDEDNDVYKYYTLNNRTKYKETIYYTFSNVGNKIIISTDEDYNTIMINVEKNKDKDIYDVVIDPGHGGMDSGANRNGYKEAEFTMQIASNLKEKLEAYGVKVKLTREENQLTLNQKLPDYGINGRATICYEVKAKYLFSIHMNSNASSSVNGLEVYTPANINYDFANTLVKNITTMTGSNYSTNKMYKVYDGIYTRTFSEADIEEAKNEKIKQDMEPYDITTKANYFYMIRETGGIITGAYVDKRNEKIVGNPYIDSNIGTESYLLELAYLTNQKDLDNMINNMDKYTEAIANTFKVIFEEDK